MTACRESGAGEQLMANIKKGSSPSIDRVEKLASYFGVTVSQLIGEDPEPNDNLDGQEERAVPMEGTLKAAFFEGGEDLTQEEMDELWEDAKDYIQYKLDQRRRRKNDQ